MIADGGYVDGSWQLKIQVDDLMVEKTLRVMGDWHIGGVMFKLAECIEMKMNWSDYALWWPVKNKWLTHTRSTLDQYGVQADSKLRFLKMHNLLSVQLPDLQTVDLNVNFSRNVFGVVVQLCKDIGIRHPEELSLQRRIDRNELRRSRSGMIGTLSKSKSTLDNSPTSPTGSTMRNSKGWMTSTPRTPNNPSDTLPRYNSSTFNKASPHSPSTYMTLPSPGSPSSFGSPFSPGGYMTLNGNGSMMIPASLNSLAFEGAENTAWARSPDVSIQEAMDIHGLQKSKTFLQRSHINSTWLESSKSLMEQGIDPANENLVLLLRFKYYAFYDLSPKYDAIRINQLFQQARWSLLFDDIECTEEEMMVFSALQLQVKLQASQTQGNEDDKPIEEEPQDEIDAILDQLTLSLEGNTNGTHNSITEIHHVPELSGNLKYFKPRRFTLKNYKRYWMVLKDTTLYVYKSQELYKAGEEHCLESLSIRGTEIQADVNLTTGKFGIKLFVPTGSAMLEVWLRCPNQEIYADWMAACRLASRGKTLASKAMFDSERATTLVFLQLQAPKAQPVLTPETMPTIDVNDYISSRFMKKLKSRSLLESILKAHANVREMSMIDAMLHYIKAWQRLPQFGVTYFAGRFTGCKKDEILGVAFNRLIRMDITTGDTLKTWRYNELKCWDVNWELKEIDLHLPKDQKIGFSPLTASCKIIHEMIGGYIFLSMRTPEKNQELDEEAFHKFTGGR